MAVSIVDEPKEVGKAVPFQSMTAPLTKPVPLTVSGNADPPAVADDGDRLVSVAGATVDSANLNNVPFPAAPPI